MEVQNTGGVTGPDPIQPRRTQASRFQPARDVSPRADRAEISEHAQFLSKLRAVPPIRTERVEALKALIASGKYETPERIASAVESLLKEIG